MPCTMFVMDVGFIILIPVDEASAIERVRMRLVTYTAWSKLVSSQCESLSLRYPFGI